VLNSRSGRCRGLDLVAVNVHKQLRLVERKLLTSDEAGLLVPLATSSQCTCRRAGRRCRRDPELNLEAAGAASPSMGGAPTPPPASRISLNCWRSLAVIALAITPGGRHALERAG